VLANANLMSRTTHTYSELMQAGRAAFIAGRRKDAHRIWKEAATLDPYNEQVWASLLEVVGDDHDRQVCLQNILQINPLNVQARRELNRVDAKLQRAELKVRESQRAIQGQQRRRRTVIFRAMLVGIAIGLSGALFAIVISILVYAR
jgi:hypothetical protein